MKKGKQNKNKEDKKGLGIDNGKERKKTKKKEKKI